LLGCDIIFSQYREIVKEDRAIPPTNPSEMKVGRSLLIHNIGDSKHP